MENQAVKAGTVLAVGLTGAVCGWFGWLLAIFVGCLVLDYLTGTAKAMKEGDWCSAVAREGIWHKLGSIVAVGVACIADVVTGILVGSMALPLPGEYTALIAPVVTVWYIITELGSVVENAEVLGAPIPGVLRKVIRGLHKAADSEE